MLAPWLRGYAPSPRTGPFDLTRMQFAGLVEYETLPGLGHFLHLEDPNQIAGLVSSFLGAR